MTAIMTSWFNQMKDGICQARQIAPEKFQALVDAGPYLGKEAVDAKLVDAVAYRDEVYGDVKSKAGAERNCSIWINILTAPGVRMIAGRRWRWCSASAASRAARAITIPCKAARIWARIRWRARFERRRTTRREGDPVPRG
jgi:ClpP class serine protease